MSGRSWSCGRSLAWALSASSLAGASYAGTASDAILGYLAVPDVDAALGHMEAVAQTFGPGKLPPGTLKLGLATAVGDPGLTGLRTGEPIVFMAFRAAGPFSPPSFSWFVPVNDAAPYERALNAQGWSTRVVEGLLLGGPNAEAVTSAESALATYRRIRDAGVKSDARIYLHLGRLMEAYGPPLTSAVEGLMTRPRGPGAAAPPEISATPGPPALPTTPSPEMLRFLKLEARAFLALAAQIEEGQADISVEPDAIASDTVFSAKAASALADLSSMPPPGRSTTRALVSGPGIMTATYQVDTPRMSAFLARALDEAAKDGDFAPLLTPEVATLTRGMEGWFSGEMTYSLRSTAASTLVAEMAMGVTNEAKCLEMVERATALMAPDSALSRMYRSMGMSYSASLAKNVRRHGGVPVHRLKMAFEAKGVPAAQTAQIQAMLKDMDVAITRGYYLASQDPAGLDRLIDRTLSGGASGATPLQAVAVFGEGRHVYFDYDFIGLLKAVAGAAPGAEAGALARLPAGTDPMTLAVSLSGGRVRTQARIPLQPFALLAQSASKAPPSPPPGPPK